MVFKTLSILEIVYLALITNVPKVIVKEFQKIQKKIVMAKLNSYSKIKHKTLFNAFKTSGLRNVDINLKVISLHLKLFDEHFHEWKVIPLHLICITFGQYLKSYSSLSYNAKLLFPLFYKNVFRYWSHHCTVSPDLPFCILLIFLWYNKDILISNKSI